MYDPKKTSISEVFKYISPTWKTPYLSVKPGTYATFKKNFSYPEVDHTDGIGTKAYYHWTNRSFKNAVLDSLAMNLNDLLLVRATPYKLQNHLVLPRDDNKRIKEILTYLASECKKRNIAITGGETSIHDFPESFDIGITISGFIKTELKNHAQKGDLVVGFKSNGLHSNGFTLIRKLFTNYREEFIEPTRIYFDDLHDIVSDPRVHGLMHITGGAFSKLHGIIGPEMDMHINNKHKLMPQKIFNDVFSRLGDNKKMYTTFNCGIGFIMTTNKKYAQTILDNVPFADVIGEVSKGNGRIHIDSAFDHKHIIL